MKAPDAIADSGDSANRDVRLKASHGPRRIAPASIRTNGNSVDLRLLAGRCYIARHFFEKGSREDAALRHLDADRAGTGDYLGSLERPRLADRLDRVHRPQLSGGAALSAAAGTRDQRFAAVEHLP